MSHGLRKGQLISVHGPGAIADIGDESFVVTTIDKWRFDGTSPCELPRLARRLGVQSLRQPKADNNNFGRSSPSVALHRFPQWMFCQRCRHMVRWSLTEEGSLEENQKPTCKRCGERPQLVPMRFIQICEEGHMDDVDWLWWVHRTPDARSQCHTPEQLQFGSRKGGGSGLGSLEIRCLSCDASRNLGDLQHGASWRCKSPTAYSGGRQPWQRSDAGTPCDQETMVVQRGDSNVYFPSVVSALDIPTSSDGSQSDSLDETIRRHPTFEVLKEMWESLRGNRIDPQISLAEMIRKRSLEWGITEEHLVQLLDGNVDLQHPSGSDDSRQIGDEIREIKAEEFAALSEPNAIESACFSGSSYATTEDQFGPALFGLLESVSLIDRLREVRALRGFHRAKPAGDQQLVRASLRPADSWLPACEVFGEGIFIKFRLDKVITWESDLPPDEFQRLQSLQERIERESLGFLPTVAPRFIAIHGLAHLLIKQLCFESGYASSSLRERIYVEDDGLGVLIYTADGDSEGTLGGLVRQGRPDRLHAVFAHALTAAAWCSGDPLCSEGTNQGIAGLNRAACHACLMVSETSCDCANALLDRRFLVGTSDGMDGLFTETLRELKVV